MGSIDNFHSAINSEQELEERLSKPTDGAIDSIAKLKGTLLILGIGGKMGPTLARMAKRAADAAGNPLRIIGVSRFSKPELREQLESYGIETIACDLLDPSAMATLPDAENILYMAGWKFGSMGNEEFLWAMNTHLPALVAERYKESKIVAFSTGNVYPYTPVESGGPTEDAPTGPVGEYAQSCLGRERMFQYFSKQYGTPGVIIRLNYSVETRYGVLLDIAQKVYDNKPITLSMGHVNVIWQGDANAQTLQCFGLCASPTRIMNITGPETLTVRWIAQQFGQRFAREPIFEGSEEPTALLNNAAQAKKIFGPPQVSTEQVIDLIAHWIKNGQSIHQKPTHFEGRTGNF
jgi:nucleoside-diphosphate-sugar epimerase